MYVSFQTSRIELAYTITLADLPIKGREIDFLDLHSCRRQIEERKGYKDFFRGVVEGFLLLYSSRVTQAYNVSRRYPRNAQM